MTDKKKLTRRIGNPPKHGAGSLVYRQEIINQYPELVRYARECHAGLVADLGGKDALSTAKQIILARLTSKILTAGLLDIYLGKNGVIRRDRLDQKVLEAEPCVETWLHVNRAILRDLQALGLERVSLEARVLTPAELLEEVGREAQAAREAAEGAREAVEASGDPVGASGEAPACGGRVDEAGSGADMGGSGPGDGQEGSEIEAHNANGEAFSRRGRE